MTTLHQLPTLLVEIVSQYLTIVESRQLVMSNSQLWRKKTMIEGSRVSVSAQTNVERQVFELVRPRKLERLDLGDSATDDYLMQFDWKEDFPLLREIALEGSNSVRLGLQSLYGHPSLEHVNVVFCPLFSYEDALRLRESLPQPNAVIQRLPNELCGVVQTNFKNDCFHRYWPDGTFKYDRDVQSVGFVKLVRKSGSRRITTMLQYCDLDPLMPILIRKAMTPGINLLPLDDNQLLVAQHLHILQPPTRYPTVDQSNLPLGQSFYIGDDGIPHRTKQHDSTFIVTKMQVHPLDVAFPPNELVATIRTELSILSNQDTM